MNPLVAWMESRVAGYPRWILQLLVAVTLGGRNVLLEGRHGMGKSVLARCLARLIDAKWVLYDAATDDLVTVAGLPDRQALEQGRLEFVKHPRTIWQNQAVLIEEINRGDAERLNLWFQALELGSLFGIRLDCRQILATCNPESDYSLTRPLDDAMLDRFSIALRLLDLGSDDASTICEVVRINWRGRGRDGTDLLPAGVEGIRSAFRASQQQLGGDEALEAAVGEWVAGCVCALQAGSEETYISKRSYGECLPNVLRDLLALEFATAGPPSSQTLKNLALWALRGCLEVKCRLTTDAVTAASNEHVAPLILWLQGIATARQGSLGAVAVGELEQRIAALERLDVERLSATDRARLDAIVRDLLRQVMTAGAAPGSLLSRLWEACGSLPQLRREIETVCLRQRLVGLIAALPGKGSAHLRQLVASRKTMAAPASWAPQAR